MTPMMRARQQQGDLIIGPVYQYNPKAVLYKEEQDFWPTMTPEQISSHIGQCMPEHLRRGWNQICQGGRTSSMVTVRPDG